MNVLAESVKNVNNDYSDLSKSVQLDQKDQFERVVHKLNDEWTYVISLRE